MRRCNITSTVDGIFPPPSFDTGWRDLMFRDEASGSDRVFTQRIE